MSEIIIVTVIVFVLISLLYLILSGIFLILRHPIQSILIFIGLGFLFGDDDEL
jgi:hypothetical protein